jgi:hypothetical protein
MRGHAGEPEHVLVIKTLGAVQRRFLTGRKAKPATPSPDPEPVTTTRATLVDVSPIADAVSATGWLGSADLDAETDAALDVINRVLQAYRIVVADPLAREAARDQALVIRVGVGEGEQVAEGRWTEAKELPRPRGPSSLRRSAALRPQERLAALLTGRDPALACEELALRARLDLDRGRGREAALQLRVALEAALAELEPWVEQHGMGERLGALREERGPVGAAANAALQGGLDDGAAADVERALRRIEAALRARTAAGFDG